MGITVIRIARGLVAAAFLSQLGLPAITFAGHLPGHTVWTNTCSGCHGATPVGNQLNAAGTTSTVLNYVIANQATMKVTASVTSLTATQRTDVANYINSVLPANTTSTPMSTSGGVNVSNNLFVGGTAFSSVVTCTSPTSGSLGSWSGTSATYTPVAGFVGQATFTYRGGGGVTGQCRTATLNVGSAPVITSSSTKNGTVGVAMTSYTITSTNPDTFGRSGTFPAGLTVSQSGATISFTGTPTTATTYTPSVTATNYWNTDSNVLTMTISPGTQTITFPVQTTPRTYSVGGTFAISTATVSSPNSGNSVVYSSLTTGVCTVSSTTVTIQSAGTCTLAANLAGNSNWNAAAQKTQSVTIDKAAQTISFGAQSPASRSYSPSGTFPLNPVATASSGLAVGLLSNTTGVCTISGTTLTMVSAGTCTILATQIGNTNYLAATSVLSSMSITPTVPAAPSIGTGSAGDAQASIAFTANTNTGGTALLDFTATCTGPSTRTATGTTSPLVVTGLINSSLYNCSVTARNATGSSVASGTVAVTPSPTPVAPAFTSAASTTFTVLTFNTFNVTASGIPTPTFTLLSGTLPSGVTITNAGTLSGTPASGTVGAFFPVFRATNTAPSGTKDQSFTLTVAKAAQVITFTALTDRALSASLVALSAGSTSGLTVAFASATPGTCSVSGTNATMLAVGTCTINATQAGNGDYAAATLAPQSFVISKGSQTITFGTQSPSSRAFTGSTFAIGPAAAASSLLAVAYTSTSPAVCSVSGTTVTMLNVGTCTIQAAQAGDSNWNAATPVTQDVTLTQGTQSITFAATQPAQSFASGGTFAISPLGTASSGLAISYSTLTPSVCTVSGTTVTMVAVGTCTVAANQDGNANYAAATQATRNITINPSLPGAPVITSAAPTASSEATVGFNAPASNGGSAIISYTATCSATGQTTRTATGPSSPLVVASLTDGVSYLCHVEATNSVGTGAASADLSVTPSAAGPGIWGSLCSSCHGSTPAGARFNAASPPSSPVTVLPVSVLNHVIATQPDMLGAPAVQALTQQQREDMVAYITGFLSPTEAATAPGVGKSITLADITLSGISYTAVEIVTPPAKGSLSSFGGDGLTLTYTSNPLFSGVDTFVYRGINPGAGLVGSYRTATITVDPSLPVLTVNLAGPGSGVAISEAPATGITCGTDCNESFDLGLLVLLSATPNPGSVFTGWSGDCSGSDFCFVTMDSPRNVTATFAVAPPALYNLAVGKTGTGAGTGTVTSSPAGISCGSTCNADFTDGASVTLTATPGANTLFSGWSGACAGTGGCTVTMSAARSVTATFTAYTPSAAADLSITQTANVGSVGTGKDVIYTITTTNNGPAAATNLVVTDSLPSGATFVWASPGCLLGGSNVNCNGGTLASGASIQFKVVMRHAAAGSPMNNVSASAGPVDPVPTNNAHALMMTVNPTPAGTAIFRYRLYSPVTLEHHFTTDANEYAVLGTFTGTWVQEGTVGKVLNNPGSFNSVTAVPYYRLYDTGTRWHHWTTDANEYYTLGFVYSGWSMEGVDGYLLPTFATGSIQLFRLNYPALGSLHHWTIDANEYNTLITPAYGWIGEGGSGFVIQ